MRSTFTFKGKPYQAILFDMDGTLIDNMMIHHEAWRVQLAEHGMHMTIEEVKAEIHGVNLEILARLFGDAFTKEQAEQFAFNKEAAYRRIYADTIKLIEGANEFLDKAHSSSVPMAVATAAPAENIDFVLTHLPISHYFSAVKHAGDVSRGKPDPEVFQLAASGLGVDVQECLIFEDSVTGALAAKNAGADSVIITTTHDISEFAEIDNIVIFADDYSKLIDELAIFTCE